MALDLWFREDVARLLASAHETMGASTAGWSHISPRLATAYQKAFMDALRVVDIAFGSTAPTPPTPVQPPESVQIVEAEDLYTHWDQGGSRS